MQDILLLATVLQITKQHWRQRKIYRVNYVCVKNISVGTHRPQIIPHDINKKFHNAFQEFWRSEK
jgi:hypothetical protein